MQSDNGLPAEVAAIAELSIHTRKRNHHVPKKVARFSYVPPILIGLVPQANLIIACKCLSQETGITRARGFGFHIENGLILAYRE